MSSLRSKWLPCLLIISERRKWMRHACQTTKIKLSRTKQCINPPPRPHTLKTSVIIQTNSLGSLKSEHLPFDTDIPKLMDRFVYHLSLRLADRSRYYCVSPGHSPFTYNVGLLLLIFNGRCSTMEKEKYKKKIFVRSNCSVSWLPGLKVTFCSMY